MALSEVRQVPILGELTSEYHPAEWQSDVAMSSALAKGSPVSVTIVDRGLALGRIYVDRNASQLVSQRIQRGQCGLGSPRIGTCCSEHQGFDQHNGLSVAGKHRRSPSSGIQPNGDGILEIRPEDVGHQYHLGADPCSVGK